MKLLFDLVTTQLFVGGAQEYIRKIFYTLIDELSSDVELWVAFDSSIKKFAYNDLTPTALNGKVSGTIDLANKSLSELIKTERFDRLFIGSAQQWGGRYNVSDVECQVISVMHDVCDEDVLYDHLNYYVKLDSLTGFVKRIGRNILGIDKKNLKRTQPFVCLAKKRADNKIISVSEFSKYSITFHLNIPLERITVLWSPERIGECSDVIEQPTLYDIIKSGRKYFLMTNANRELKNAKKVINAFKRYSQDDSDCILVTVGYPNSEFPNHIILPYLSESDLINAQKHCYAFIFSSFYEGFGYPPVEAMRWSKPVIASNVTSIPNVLGSAAIYFSPYNTSDIYYALQKFRALEYDELCKKSKQRYIEINERQKRDLDTIISYIAR